MGSALLRSALPILELFDTKKMKSSRQRLLEYLQNRRMASTTEMSRALHLTGADIRHHLSIMMREGVVEVISQRPTGGRGRPTQMYGLTQQALQHNLDGLASALLEEIVVTLSQETREVWLRNIACRLMGNNPPSSRNPTQRLFAAINIFNDMHYQARWEAHTDAPRVLFAHCPYAAILPEHPELCKMDMFLLEQMLGQPSLQIAKQEVNPQGIPHCIFRIGK